MGAAVAGVLVLGGGVAAAGPASAVQVPVPVARPAGQAPTPVRATPMRTAPGRVPHARAGLRAHRITDMSATRRIRKARRSVVGRALDAVFGWFAVAALVVLLVVVLLVYAIRRRNGR